MKFKVNFNKKKEVMKLLINHKSLAKKTKNTEATFHLWKECIVRKNK